jgi:hypothetical protein
MSQTIKLDKYQLVFAKAISDGNNAKCNAVYGAGKTTMSLLTAQLNPGKKFLLLLYNTRLKIETQARIELLKLKNIKALSIHACATKYYKLCHNDFQMQEILEENNPSFIKPNFNVLICDEAQDFNKMYKRFTKKILRDLCHSEVQMGIIGDKRQLLYDYNNATPKYLLNPEKYFSLKNKTWIDCPLKISYRLTFQNAQFLNKCVLKEDVLETPIGKVGPKPMYYQLKSNFDLLSICRLIIHLLETNEPNDIYILSYSIKSPNGPARKLENLLVKNKIKCYVPIGDDAVLDNDLMKGKISFMTFHQSKGTENKIIIILGFDESLMKYYKQDTTKCSNALAVALSRSKGQLIMCASISDDKLKFLDLDPQLVDIVGIKEGNYIRRNNNFDEDNLEKEKKTKEIYISSMTNHKPFDILKKALDLVNYEILQEPIRKHEIDIKIHFIKDDNWEEISEMYGVLIPSIFEYSMYKKCSLEELAGPINDNLKNNLKNHLKNNKTLMKYVLKYVSLRDKFKFKKVQVTNFDWVDDEAIESAVDTLKCYLTGNNLSFEHSLSIDIDRVKIMGRCDIVDPGNKIIWEIKCTKELKKEHILQLAGYLAIAPKEYQIGNLLNAFTGEIIQVKRPISDLDFLKLFLS